MAVNRCTFTAKIPYSFLLYSNLSPKERSFSFLYIACKDVPCVLRDVCPLLFPQLSVQCHFTKYAGSLMVFLSRLSSHSASQTGGPEPTNQKSTCSSLLKAGTKNRKWVPNTIFTHSGSPAEAFKGLPTPSQRPMLAQIS